MSTTVVTYSIGEHGPETASEIPKMPELLKIRNIDEVASLKNGFIAFYGFRDANQGMREVRRHYFNSDQKVNRIALRIDTYNKSQDSRGTLENLSTQESLSLWRCDKALANKICAILSTTNIEYTIANDIRTLDTLWNHPLFKHIKVFMWRGDYGVTTKVAAVKDFTDVDVIDVT